MSKVITTPTPDWFWESKSFTEEKRLPKYDNFPTTVLPNNKISASMLRQDTEIPQISNGKHPLEKTGHNLFYTNHGGLTNYTNDKLVVFTDVGTNANPTDENGWHIIHRPEKIQWLNGEAPLGYQSHLVLNNTSKKNKLNQIIGDAIAANPQVKFSIYSWLDVVQRYYWYNNDVFTMMGYINNPSTIYSAQVDAGCNSIMEAVYSTNDNQYDISAIFILKAQLVKLKYGNTIPFYGLMWTNNEGVDDFPNPSSVKRKRQDGVFINLKELKHNANAEFMYNVAMACLTIGDGLLGWEGTMTNLITESASNEPLSFDVVGGTDVYTSVGNESWALANARQWKSCKLFWDLAMYQVSLYKDIIEAAINDWQTPDFEYNNNIRTGDYKHIPYNKSYKEPVIILKYNDLKTEALILVHNPWATNLDTKQVRVFDTTTGLNETLMVKGTKCELYKVIL